MYKKWYLCLLLLLVCLAVGVSLCRQAALCDEPPQNANTSPAAGTVQTTPQAAATAQPVADQGGPDSPFFYAFLQNNAPVPQGPVNQFLQRINPSFAQQNPRLQWFYWANKRQQPLRAFGFMLVGSLITWSLFPAWMQSAQQACRQRFWRTFFAGILTTLVALMFMRWVLLTQIGWPLGIALAAVFQFLLLCGLTVAISMIGHTLGVYLKIQNWPWLSTHPAARRFGELLMGSLICALLLQIGAPAHLPRIGTRLVALFAVLGFGGLYRTRPGRLDS
jgi:hypothetical protein